jgi:hypothetical protein
MSGGNSYRVIVKNEDGLEVLEFDEDAGITNSPIDLKERTKAITALTKRCGVS